MAQQIHKVRTQAQIDCYRDEFRRGIETILKDTLVDDQTVDDIYAQLTEHLDQENGLWVVLDEGRLVAWISAKCYHDHDRKTACITWAYSTPRSRANDLVMETVEKWARAENCRAIYCARRMTRLRAFLRRLRHYGYEFECIVMAKDFVPAEADAGHAATG